MASPLFDMEDQTDEDFFDKLVNDDDDDLTVSVPTRLESADSVVAKVFSNLSIEDAIGVVDKSSGNTGSVLAVENNGLDDVDFTSLDNHEENVVCKESDTVVHSSLSENGNVSSEVGIGEEAQLDSATDRNGLGSEKGVKVVQWSSFSSDKHSPGRSGFGLGSSSDFFNEFGDNSEDPFANVGNMENLGIEPTSTDAMSNAVTDLGSSTYVQNQDGQHHGSGSEPNAFGQDLTSSHYWETQYPGWQYDLSTGQWLPVEGYNGNAIANLNTLQSFDVNTQLVSETTVLDQRSDAYLSQQVAQSVVTNVTEGYTTDAVSNLNQSPQGSTEYPAHMVFDPRYPGWYYDTIAQEWKSLESYTPSINQSASVDYNQQYQIKSMENIGSQIVSSQDNVENYSEPVSNSNQENKTVWETRPALNSGIAVFTGSQQLGNQYGLNNHVNNSVDQQAGFKSSGSISYGMASPGFDSKNEVTGLQSFKHDEQFSQYPNQAMVASSQQINFSPPYFVSQKSISFSQQLPMNGSHFSNATSEGRSSAGHPAHALVTFGFGGKLLVMKNSGSVQTNSIYEGKEPMGGVINVLNLMEVVDKTNTSSFGLGVDDYFHSLCQQSFPGPLVGGSVGSKELNRWIDDQITNFESPHNRNGETMKLLFSLLKISCQHYGKLRLPFGTDQGLKESDCPELAVAKLFASSKSSFAQPNGYYSSTHCLQNFPSEAQIQATALQVQKLLISGRKKEALECAQEGQLWGPALVLASQLGDQFYGETVKQMALKQLVSGSPLRTLCLLIAGNPADVFSNAGLGNNLPGLNAFQQPAQIGVNVMLDAWEENLAIMTANRTKGDELVIFHLGDCLWKERGEVTAAHLCYLIAEANFEPYFDGARLCLVGADHWKCPRTYASPAAIQRTELYEYSKVLGNSQFLLLPLQPYKLVYAYMLAEVGKVNDSLKYCQAILRCLKTGRAPEVDTWRQLVLSLEERLRIHQQGGYGDNLKRKLLTLIDSTAQRVVGGPPPPVPSATHNSFQHSEYYHPLGGPNVPSSQTTMPMLPLMPSASMEPVRGPNMPSQSMMPMLPLLPSASMEPLRGPNIPGSQSTMPMPPLMPSASMEPISEWAGNTNQPTVPNRSISEPDFGRTPGKVLPAKEASPPDNQEKVSSVSNKPSRFSRFGSALFQNTVGLVLRPRPDRQAKLGEKNKFYYDEKLKRWVEEGTEPPAEEAALPPPPTTASFQIGTPNRKENGASESESFYSNSGPEYKSPITSERNSGIPPMPPSSNQFSARGRMGVRARYVDTFNKGGGTPTSLFQSPPVLASKPVVGSSPKFFIPTPVASAVTVQIAGESTEEVVVMDEDPTSSLRNELVPSPPTFTVSPTTMRQFPPSPLTSTASLTTIHRFSSADNILQKQSEAREDVNNSLPESRRVASWSGSIPNSFNPKTDELKPLEEALGMSPPSYKLDEFHSKQLSTSGSNSGDELHEVQL